MDTPDGLRETAGLKTQADSSLIRRIETAKFIYWGGSLIIAGVVAVTLWVAAINYRNDSLRTDVDRNRRDIEAIKPRVDEMWWMKEAGITNADVKRAQQPKPSITP